MLRTGPAPGMERQPHSFHAGPPSILARHTPCPDVSGGEWSYAPVSSRERVDAGVVVAVLTQDREELIAGRHLRDRARIVAGTEALRLGRGRGESTILILVECRAG